MAKVMTVLGEVESSKLGVTLTHEHLFFNGTPEYRYAPASIDYDLMVEELSAFKDAGGGTLVDVTSRGLRDGAVKDPEGLLLGRPSEDEGRFAPNSVLAVRQLARDVGINIVFCTGFYREPFLDREWFDRNSVDAITDLLVRDITEGIDGTNVRAGIIGEIGTQKWYISAAEERSFRAAARAHLKTGLTITTHATPYPNGLNQLDILESEGVDPGRVVIGHCDKINIPEYHDEVVRRGAWVQFDTIHGVNERETQLQVSFVLRQVEKGHLDRILLSHDAAKVEHRKYAGGNGYAYIPTGFAERLCERGMTAADVQTMLVDNPRRMLTGG